MEMVAGAASVSQLVAYSLSSARYIQQLYTEVQGHGSTYRNQETNLGLLLDIIKGFSKQGVSDDSPVLPVLIDISKLACDILHLLQPRKLWGFDWTPFTKQEALRSAFETLDKKQKLLHLHISHANSQALATIQQALVVNTTHHSGDHTQKQAMKNSPKKTGASKKATPPKKADAAKNVDSPGKTDPLQKVTDTRMFVRDNPLTSYQFTMKNVIIGGYNEIMSGHDLPNEVDIEGLEVRSRASNLLSNRNGGADISQIAAILERQPEHSAAPSWKAQTPEDQPTAATDVLAGQQSSTRAGPTTQRPDTNTGETPAAPSINVVGDRTYAAYVEQRTWSSSTGGGPFMTAPQSPVLIEKQPPDPFADLERVSQVTQGYEFTRAAEFKSNEADDDPQENFGNESRPRAFDKVIKRNGKKALQRRRN
jgi:hypothetical protein